MTLPVISVAQAVGFLRAGEIIAYPTEAVFGLGCDPFDELVVGRLLALKQRKSSAGLILIGNSLEQFSGLLADIDDKQLAVARASWPGPYTWLLPADPGAPKWLTGDHATLAVRISAHPVCRDLCEQWGGPLVSTSANVTGKPPADNLEDLNDYFDGRLPGVVAGELGGLLKPTRIQELQSGALVRD